MSRAPGESLGSRIHLDGGDIAVHFWLLIVTAWWLLMGTTPAHAYLDPGTGGMLLQLLLAGIAGLIIWLKLNWRRFTIKIGLRKPDPEDKKPPDGD